jgi:amino acid transporter
VRRTISPSLYVGFAVASIGGPLALVSLVPDAAGRGLRASGLTVLLASALFLVPLYVWYRYSEEIASAGGLYAFAEAAVGRRIALVQAAAWTVSYGLYLAYTVAFVVYDQLPVVFPGISPYRSTLEIALPVALSAALFAPLRWILLVLLAGATLQLGLLLVLGVLELRHVGATSDAFAPHHGVVRGGANVSLLFVCASLPLFLGGEVKGGARTVRYGLVAAFFVVVAYFVFAAFPLARVPDRLLDSAMPTYAIAQAYSGRALAVAVGSLTVASILGLVVAEFVALSRLLTIALRLPLRRVLAGISVAFVAADAISLVNPDAFYEHALKPSLGALYVSQVIVFAAFPFLRRRDGAVRVLDVGAAAGASALMVWGLYLVAANQLAS